MVHEVDTPQGIARVLVQHAQEPKGALVLGHGAGGSVSAPDLQAATRVALEEDLTVVLVEQPYRVAGRRSTPPAPRLDEAWLAVIAALELDLPLITGGRSSGARVACRTAAATGSIGVLCLAFPLQPRGRSSGTLPPS
ncbi:MAG TPA: alpha/beta family hydrolase, partial [Thermoleophilaceae bacterium]|nr:alpha/beta family hydrolase [Thermoleophilaceae bacterium]